MLLHACILVTAIFSRPGTTEVALTVDDLPGDIGPMEAIIAALAQHRIPHVLGFVNGIQLEGRPEGERWLHSWLNAGHRLGNHTYSHADLKTVPTERYLEDIARNEALLGKVTGDANGTGWRLFRYPFLKEGNDLTQRQAIRAYLQSHGYRVAQVTVDPFDWACDDAYLRCRRRGDEASMARIEAAYLDDAVAQLHWAQAAAQAVVGRRIKHILLTHVRTFTAHMQGRLLERLRAEGVRFIDIEAALQDPVYGLDVEMEGSTGGPFLWQAVRARGVPGLPTVPVHPTAWLDSLCQT